MSNTITAQLNGVSKHPSKYGGDFYYLFFKDLQTGESYKSCTGPSYRNWKNWEHIVTNYQTGHPIVLSNLILRGNLIDADSRPTITE